VIHVDTPDTAPTEDEPGAPRAPKTAGCNSAAGKKPLL